MSIATEISLCFVEDFSTLKEGIFSITNISKSGLKKFQLNKKFLNKSIRVKDEISLPLILLNHGLINPVYVGEAPEIVFEDKNFLVISKPPKIHSHPLSYGEGDNLLSFLNSKHLKVNTTKYDRGLVYRLDYETSGILYYAKSDRVYKSVRDGFSSIVREKHYLAIVSGELQSQKVQHFLATGELRGSLTKEDINGKECDIEIELLDFNMKANKSLVRVKLHQGFKHQIRAQLSFIGYPIVGDELYGGEPSSRVWLHCYQYSLSFDDVDYNQKDRSRFLASFLADFDCKL
jgi:23S rRNA pseudouridine1911/1915/1917 synthase